MLSNNYIRKIFLRNLNELAAKMPLCLKFKISEKIIYLWKTHMGWFLLLSLTNETLKIEMNL